MVMPPVDVPSASPGLFARLFDRDETAPAGNARANLRPLLPYPAAPLPSSRPAEDGVSAADGIDADARMASNRPGDGSSRSGFDAAWSGGSSAVTTARMAAEMPAEPAAEPAAEMATRVAMPRPPDASGESTGDSAARGNATGRSASMLSATPGAVRVSTSSPSAASGQRHAETGGRLAAMPSGGSPVVSEPGGAGRTVAEPMRARGGSIGSEAREPREPSDRDDRGEAQRMAALARPTFASESPLGQLRSKNAATADASLHALPTRAEPTIEIHIGRIEVRAQAAAPAPAAPAPRASGQPSASLSVHLGARARGARS